MANQPGGRNCKARYNWHIISLLLPNSVAMRIMFQDILRFPDNRNVFVELKAIRVNE